VSHCVIVWHRSWVLHLWHKSHLSQLSLACVIGHLMCHRRPAMNGFKKCREGGVWLGGVKKCFLGLRFAVGRRQKEKMSYLRVNCNFLSRPNSLLLPLQLKVNSVGQGKQSRGLCFCCGKVLQCGRLNWDQFLHRHPTQVMRGGIKADKTKKWRPPKAGGHRLKIDYPRESKARQLEVSWKWKEMQFECECNLCAKKTFTLVSS
jgi:hypothetical protein